MEPLRVPGWLRFSLAILVALNFRQVVGTLRAHRELTVTSFSISSAIVSRYSRTRVVSVMANPHPEALEAVFDLDLPSLAFISNFTMTVDGRVYPAQVKERQQAKKMYEEARKRGQTAAHVASRGDEVEKFRISTSVAGGGQVTFSLTYEQLLPRLLGRYQHAVSVRPGQVVPDLSVEVTVWERTGIDHVRVLPLQTSHLLTNVVRGEGAEPASTRIEKGETCARVTFTPSPSEQAAYSSQGIAGDFVIQYDVTMKDAIGDVQIHDGYFVHYFAPRDLPRLPKNVVFVIDVSGSMTGTKLKQTKKAMHVILGDLRPEDRFNIVTFSDTAHVWRAAGSVQATPRNIQRAKAHVGRMQAARWTDMNAALLAAASTLNQSTAAPSGEARLILLLSDGEPTAGVTSPARVLANARRALAGRAALFGLALGDDADLPLLRRLSLENRGTAHRIREDRDAASQLKGFYDRIASPLLSDIHLHYQARRAGAASPPRSHFPNYFEGSELLVVGQLAKGEPELRVRLEARGPHDQPFTAAWREEAASGGEPASGCPSQGEPALGRGFLPRLWAYVTIQRLLEGRLEANASAVALNLSLHFHFVTPLTSLVVVRPEEEDEGEPGPRLTLTSTRAPVTTGKPPRPPTSAEAGSPRGTEQDAPPPIPRAKPARGDPRSAKARAPPSPTPGSSAPPGAGPVTPVTSVTPQAGALSLAKPKSSSRGDPGSPAPPRPGSLTSPEPSARIHPSPNTPGALDGPLSSPSPSLQKQGSPGPPRTVPSSNPHGNTPNPNASYFPKQNAPLPPPRGRLAFPKTRPKSDTVGPSQFPPRARGLPRPNPSAPSQHTPPKWDLPASQSPRSPSLPGATTLLLQSVATSPHASSARGPGPSSPPHLGSPPLPQAGVSPYPKLGAPAQSGPTLQPSPTPASSSLSALSPPPPEIIDVLVLPEEPGQLLETPPDSGFLESLKPPALYAFPAARGRGGRPGSQGKPREAPAVFTFSSSVDGDPHFEIQLPNSESRICFTVDGRPGDTLQLLGDPEAGLQVSGHLLGAPPKAGHEHRTRTYFDGITVAVRRLRAPFVIHASPRQVSLEMEGVTRRLGWEQPLLVLRPGPGPELILQRESTLTVRLGLHLEFLIRRHRDRRPTPLRLPHLGFYVVNGHGLSRSARGLLGQSQYTGLLVKQTVSGAWLERPQGPSVPLVSPGPERDLLSGGPCWRVKHQDVEKLLGRPYGAFVL